MMTLVQRISMLAGLISGIGFSQEWTSRSPAPSSFPMNGLACSPKVCVGIDASDNFVVTQDGQTWKSSSSKIGILSSVIWTGQKFFAVGGWAVATSLDGMDWDIRRFDSDTRYWMTNTAGYAFGRYYAVGGDSMLVSSDGSNWQADSTACHVMENASFVSHGSVALIVKEFMTCRSVDSGKTWTIVPVILTTDSQFVQGRSVAWDGKKFVIGGSEGVVSSADGVTWTLERKDQVSAGYLAGDSSVMIGLGANGIELRHSDGTWEVVDSGDWSAYKALQKSPWGFLAVGDVGAWASSANGLHWVGHRASGSYRAVEFARGQFVAVGDSGLVSRSADGVSWTNATSAARARLRSIASDSSKVLVVGDSGQILSSTDLITWERIESGSHIGLTSVAWDGKQFVAVGDSGTVLTSTDGRSWKPDGFPNRVRLVRVQSGAGKLISLDVTGQLWVRGEQGAWTAITMPEASFATLGGSSSSGFVATDRSNLAWRSEDGIVWKKAVLEGAAFMTNVVQVQRSKEQWYAIGEDGRVYSSVDGEYWHGYLYVSQLTALATHDGLMVGVGTNAFIATSPEVVNPTSVQKKNPRVRQFSAWIRSGRLFLKSTQSESLDLSLKDAAGKEIIHASRAVTANQELALPLPSSPRSNLFLIVRSSTGTRSVSVSPDLPRH